MITEQDFEFTLEKYPPFKKIDALEKQMLSMPQVPCSVNHKFGPGLYMREVLLPKGAIVIGHHQNFEHMNVFLKGKITFIQPDGSHKTLSAPMTFTGPPGRKIAFIHEDSVWMNVYATNETDIEKLEVHYLTKSEAVLTDYIEKDKVLNLMSDLDKKDFEMFCMEFGLSQEQVKIVSENKEDLIELPYGSYKIKTGKSNIEGIGLIATADIVEEEIIAPARINGKRTIAGRYTNHSLFPNAKMVRGLGCQFGDLSEIELVAIKKIKGCQGGQDGEEITIDYRKAFRLNREIGDKKCQQ